MKMIRNPYNPRRFPLLVVISGPSGVGKDTLVQGLKKRAYPFYFVVTATSRPPRAGEVHGVDYFFVSEAEFEDMIQHNELLEHAMVYGQHKGIPKQQVRAALASGKDVVMRLDVQGAATVKRIVPEAVLIFLSAGSEQELYHRLEQRCTESKVQLDLRIRTARKELKQLDKFDYVVINRDGEVEKAVGQVLNIVHAEHCRVHPRRIVL
jgi:guanylate kinase